MLICFSINFNIVFKGFGSDCMSYYLNEVVSEMCEFFIFIFEVLKVKL